MRYLNTHNIVSAYQNNAKTTKNKFWGLLALLSGVGQKVQPGVNYYFNQQFVGSVLDRLFLLDGQKKSLSIGKLTSNVIFSTHWIEVVKTDMVVGKPNIYDVATWYFRNEEFEEGITAKGLVTRFIDELYLSEDFVNTIFSLTEERQIIFERYQASDQDILSKLNLQTSTGSITAESSTIAAFPRELSRAPFFQTLYSSQSILAGLIITNFDFAEYYLVSQSQAQVLPKSYNGDKGQLLQLYKYFITNCTLKAKSITNYTDFKRINECIAQLGLDGYKELLDFDNPVALENAIEKLKEQPLYIDYNKRGNNQYSATIGTYLQFLYALQLSGVDKVSSFPSLPSLDPSQCTKYIDIITAAKTKPFILLAGISGTGKSRIVRELARACWDEGSEEYNAQKPQNFEMIQVKPNWHDSTELLGYVSRVSGKPVYVMGDFLRFITRAWENIDVPHFLCLDEMNLAPVEQYFAEYLSVVESRKLRDGKVVTDAILKKCSEQWFFDLTAQLTEDEGLRSQFNNEGIALPPNLIVVGTVNMDETTFSFSRKVLDRAMTIEMNEVDLWGGLDSKYERIGKLSGDMLIGKAVEGVDVYADNKEVCDIALEYLKSVNEILDKTPFKVAYRTRNEFLLYVVNNLPYTIGEDGTEYSRENVIATALDEITSMKILSRIEGDDTKVPKTLLTGLKHCIEAQLLKITGEDDKIESVSIAKLDEMLQRLESGYTSFWS